MLGIERLRSQFCTSLGSTLSGRSVALVPGCRNGPYRTRDITRSEMYVIGPGTFPYTALHYCALEEKQTPLPDSTFSSPADVDNTGAGTADEREARVENRNTLEECGECGESTGGLHRCDVCSKKMHGFCGVGIGDECMQHTAPQMHCMQCKQRN